ncbi:MAG TPA: GNAT family N-acetyltransferase [Pyrinomonadaceae bacterium]|jgi:GNAT superfamily N-acetyltransferase
MLDDLELMNIHARALFIHANESRILFVNEPDNTSAPAPRLFLGRTLIGNIRRFRADLPDKLCRELDALCADEPPVNTEFNAPPRHFETFIRLLESDAPVESVENGLAYQFIKDEMPFERVTAVTEDNPEILQGGFEKLIEELPAWQPFVAMVQENRAVSICRSVRITAEAHEAGVETLPEFRGNGYAAEVVSEWARLVRKAGAIPLYSTSFENHASQAVTRKLGLKCYGVSFHIT